MLQTILLYYPCLGIPPWGLVFSHSPLCRQHPRHSTVSCKNATLKSTSWNLFYTCSGHAHNYFYWRLTPVNILRPAFIKFISVIIMAWSTTLEDFWNKKKVNTQMNTLQMLLPLPKYRFKSELESLEAIVKLWKAHQDWIDPLLFDRLFSWGSIVGKFQR